MKKHMFLVSVLVFLLAGFGMVTAQENEPDPAIKKAKEDTVVVYDLGRFFGYLLTMEEEVPKRALSNEQLETVYEIALEIKNLERIEPEWAEERLDYLELDVLTVDQLLEVDLLIIAREESRVPQEKNGGGSSGGTGTNPLQTFVAGGAFNPIIDEAKSIGEGFYAFLEYAAEKLGK